MTKLRVLLLLITFIVVGVAGTLTFLYAQGYRINPQTGKISPSGILVIKSTPDGAQIFINGELKTATNATISLYPDTYDVSVKKEGFFEWKKRLIIKKEEVTEATAHLFRSVPSLSAVSFSGAINPTPSTDLTKIAYYVPPGTGNGENTGLWVIENLNLPLGFAKDPRRITDGSLADASWIWSPNGRQILLTTPKGVYLIESGSFTPQEKRVNVSFQKEEILEKWEKDAQVKLDSQLKKLPDELESILQRKASQVTFSPDEDMVAYTASGAAVIPENLIKKLPGSSTQKEERTIKNDQTYIYDIKEDKNFLIDEKSSDLNIRNWKVESGNFKRRLIWFPSSRHLILAEEGKITIMDYDGTNRQVVYSGSYVAPNAFPTLSLDRLLILTNLGSDGTSANLYSLSLK